MPLPESFSVTRSAARVIISALAVSALSLSLVACSSPIVPETPGTTSQAPSSPAEPSSTPPTEPAADAANFAKLQAFVASQQAAVPQVLAQFPDTYSDFRLEAEAPGTVVFTYVYMGMMDPIVTAANFEATAAQQLQDACDTQLFPTMRAAGISDPMTVRYVYLNADGSTIWERDFVPST